MTAHRQTKILEVLSKHGRAEVLALAELLRVSQVTIRKDLDILENRKLVRREHGYARLNNADDVGKRIAFNYDIKRRIAKAAAATVNEGETVMIESGSCCALLAEELAGAQKDVTIITNSVFIVNFIRNAARTKIILLGGYFQPESQVLVGPMTRQCSAIFFADKFFVGADGFIANSGFTGRDHMRSQTVMDMAENANQVSVLTDAEKFSRQGVMALLRLEKVTNVFTDDRIPAEAERQLLEKNVRLFKVPEIEEEEAYSRPPRSGARRSLKAEPVI
ncbi:MAG: DeoR/GlpR family DNA-binding transcription regulator [Treponema sp.]|nr:DeoR/GlpR family DNA-binding transcription regulator [Treponema sp.]